MIEHIQSLITNIVERVGTQGAAYGVTAFLYDSYGSLTNETVIGVAGTNTITRYWDDYGRTMGYALNGTRQTTIEQVAESLLPKLEQLSRKMI